MICGARPASRRAICTYATEHCFMPKRAPPRSPHAGLLKTNWPCAARGGLLGRDALLPIAAPAAPGRKDCAKRQWYAYKALPGATYGGGEEAGGLLSKSPWRAGSLLPGTDQASRPSREGTIIAVVIRGDDPRTRRARAPRSPRQLPPARRPMAETAIAAGAQVSGGDATRTQLSQASQRRKR